MMNLLCVALGVLCFGEGQPPKIPDGWVFVEEEGIDVAAGAYHDRVSGLFVVMEADFAGDVIAPWALGEAAKREVAPREYKKGRAFVRDVVWTDSATGCDTRVVSISCAMDSRESWNLSADLCRRDQRERLEGLLETLAASDWPRIGPPPRLLQAGDMEALAAGQHWMDVREALGHGDSARKSDAGGFVVTYEVGGRLVDLEFSQQQRLIHRAR